MKANNRLIKNIFILLGISAVYLSINHFLLNTSEPSVHGDGITVDKDESLDIQCNSLPIGVSRGYVETALTAQNRKLSGNTNKGKIVTYWMTNGMANLHLPKGIGCVAYFSTEDILQSIKVKSFD